MTASAPAHPSPGVVVPEGGKAFGPWHPGIESQLPRELLPLSTMFRPENVRTSVAQARELRDLTGLDLSISSLAKHIANHASPSDVSACSVLPRCVVAATAGSITAISSRYWRSPSGMIRFPVPQCGCTPPGTEASPSSSRMRVAAASRSRTANTT